MSFDIVVTSVAGIVGAIMGAYCSNKHNEKIHKQQMTHDEVMRKAQFDHENKTREDELLRERLEKLYISIHKQSLSDPLWFIVAEQYASDKKTWEETQKEFDLLAEKENDYDFSTQIMLMHLYFPEYAEDIGRIYDIGVKWKEIIGLKNIEHDKRGIHTFINHCQDEHYKACHNLLSKINERIKTINN
jgi:hypothetical protein